MYELQSESSFDAAHFLKGYEGKCANLHGHRWRVVAAVRGEDLGEAGQTKGMVLDFSDLKGGLREICDRFDHSFLYERGSLREKTLQALEEEGFFLNEVAFRPTAENFAKYFFDEMRGKGFPVYRITVYETPNNCAAYEEMP